MLELKKKSPNRGYTTDPVHIAEVGAGLWGMLPFSTKAIRRAVYPILQGGPGHPTSGSCPYHATEVQGYLDPRFALQSTEPNVSYYAQVVSTPAHIEIYTQRAICPPGARLWQLMGKVQRMSITFTGVFNCRERLA